MRDRMTCDEILDRIVIIIRDNPPSPVGLMAETAGRDPGRCGCTGCARGRTYQGIGWDDEGSFFGRLCERKTWISRRADFIVFNNMILIL
jgi:hypothetical protein